MSVTFHILDALSRDQSKTITRETEEELEIQYEYDEIDDNDTSYGTNTSKKSMIIHLFGMTAEGESLRCDVEGFRPYLYIKVPPSRLQRQAELRFQVHFPLNVRNEKNCMDLQPRRILSSSNYQLQVYRISEH